MTYQPVSVLRVFAWGQLVGAVAGDERGICTFEYDPQWVRGGIELAPTLMRPTLRRRSFTFPGYSRETFHGLPPMLADSVPDRFGNAIIDAELAREGIRARDVSALDRLAYVGERGMGALTYLPDTGPSATNATPVALADLVTVARAAVQGSLDDDQLRTESLNQLLAVGTSAGGARAKAVLAWNRHTNDLRAGNLPAPPGYEQWLLKFDGVGVDAQLGSSQQYGRIEYAYSRMAVAAGIAMGDCVLLEEGGRAHFMTRRFDRSTDVADEPAGGKRLHLQSLCALAGLDYNQTGTHDYASLLLQCDDLGLGADSREEAFRRMAFNVLASNCDDHTKNHSFLMTPDGEWSLSPAYDITFAHNPNSRWLARHLMSVNGKFDDIRAADFEEFADRFRVPGYRGVLDQVADAVGDWPKFARTAGVSSEAADEIDARLREVSLHL
jgi:serine/threonine-protein kinase HipA